MLRFVAVSLLALALSLGALACGEEAAPASSTVAAPTPAGEEVLLPADSPASQLACTVARGAIDQAAGIYLAKNQRPPRSVDELVAAGMFDRRLACPSGGKYSFNAKYQSRCSVHSAVER